MAQPCRHPQCPQLVPKGYCPEHARELDRAYKQRGQRGHYKTKRWRMLARRVLNEQPVCACGELTTQVDHIVPVEDGGAMWARSNLQAMCITCHSRKTRVDVGTRTFQ